MAAFTNAKNFAVISGRSVAEIRQMCKLQVIPNEKSGRDYLIDIDAAMEILKKRAANFEGHQFEFTPKPPKSEQVTMPTHSRKKTRKKTGSGFLDMLNQLAKEVQTG